MAPTKLDASVDVIRQQVLVLGAPADQPTALLQVHQHRGGGLATAVLSHVFQGVGANIEQGNYATAVSSRIFGWLTNTSSSKLRCANSAGSALSREFSAPSPSMS